MTMRAIMLGAAALVICACAPETPDAESKADAKDKKIAAAAPANRPSPPEFRAYSAAAVDQTVDACQNFYAYACGGWHASNPRPEGRAYWGRFFTQYQDEVAAYTRELIENMSRESQSADERKLATYFGTCMDKESVEETDLAGFNKLFSNADITPSVSSFSSALANAALLSDYYNDSPLFSAHVDGDPIEGSALARLHLNPGRLGLYSANNYAPTDVEAQRLKPAYIIYLAKMLTILGYESESAEPLSQDIYRIESALAAGSTSTDELRNNAEARTALRTVEELNATYSNLDWSAYFKTLGVENVDGVNLNDSQYFTTLNEQMAAENLPALKALAKIRMLESARLALPQSVGDAVFDFYGRTMFGNTEPRERWTYCINAIKSDLREPLGRIFVAQTVDAETTALAKNVFEEVRSEMRSRIGQADWMSEQSKIQAREKLEAVRFFAGAPQQWTDSVGFDVPDTEFIAIRQSLAAAHRQRAFANLGAPMDIDNWLFPVSRLVGYYENDKNAVFMTAAMLYPYVTEADDPGIRYGGLGVFLAHELSHGFDTLGSQYDSSGRKRNWWGEGEQVAYQSQTQCVRDEAAGLTYQSGDAVNPDLVVSEYGAELSSHQMAYELLRTTIDGDDLEMRRRFFETSAQFYCMAASDQMWRDIAIDDSHIFGEPAVNSMVRNMPGFSEAFGCKPGDPMVKAEEEKICRVW